MIRGAFDSILELFQGAFYVYNSDGTAIVIGKRPLLDNEGNEIGSLRTVVPKVKISSDGDFIILSCTKEEEQSAYCRLKELANDSHNTVFCEMVDRYFADMENAHEEQ